MGTTRSRVAAAFTLTSQAPHVPEMPQVSNEGNVPAENHAAVSRRDPDVDLTSELVHQLSLMVAWPRSWSLTHLRRY